MVNLKNSISRDRREAIFGTMPEGQPYWKYSPNPDNVKPKPIQQKIRKFIDKVDTRLP